MTRVNKIGSAITHVSPTMPDDLTGLEAWYTSDFGVYSDAAGTPITDGGDVKQWNDRSGNARHLTAATGRLPLYALEYANANNWPTLQFNGSSDSMQTAELTTPLTSAIHIFVIGQIAGNTNNDKIFDGVDASAILMALEQRGGGTGHRVNLFGYNTESSSDFDTFTDDDSGYHIIEVLIDGASSYFNEDNGSSQAVDGITGQQFNGITLAAKASGVANFGAIDISEVAVFSNAITGTDLTELITYFKNKYSIA